MAIPQMALPLGILVGTPRASSRTGSAERSRMHSYGVRMSSYGSSAAASTCPAGSAPTTPNLPARIASPLSRSVVRVVSARSALSPSRDSPQVLAGAHLSPAPMSAPVLSASPPLVGTPMSARASLGTASVQSSTALSSTAPLRAVSPTPKPTAPLWNSQIKNGGERSPHRDQVETISAASSEAQLGVSVLVKAADASHSRLPSPVGASHSRLPESEPQNNGAICPYCGNEYMPDAEYCRKCGRKREVGKPETFTRLRSPSPKRILADDEIPSAIASVKSLRQSIEVLREQQHMQVDVLANPQKHAELEDVKRRAMSRSRQPSTEAIRSSRSNSPVARSLATAQADPLPWPGHGIAAAAAQAFGGGQAAAQAPGPAAQAPLGGQAAAQALGPAAQALGGGQAAAKADPLPWPASGQATTQAPAAQNSAETVSSARTTVHLGGPFASASSSKRGETGVEEEEKAKESEEEKSSCVTEVAPIESELRPLLHHDIRADLASRQDQQEVRIHALNTKVRLLEQELNEKFSKIGRNGLVPEVSAMQRIDSTADKADVSRLDNELDAFRKELKAEQMEHSLSMVQESNTLRSDVLHAFRISLSNEREARTRDIADVRSAIEVVQDKLMQDLHMTMDLVGARLEDHLQEAVRPQSICAKLAGGSDFMQLLKDSGFQSTAMSPPTLSPLPTTPLAQTRSPTTPQASDDMVLATAAAVEELAKKLHVEQEARTKSLSDLREMFVHEVSSLQAALDSSSSKAAITSVSNSVQALKHELENEIAVERKTRSQENAQLQKRLESTLAKLEAASASMEAATSAATSTMVRGLDEERTARSTAIQELRHTLFGGIGEMRTKTTEEAARRLGEENEVRRASMLEIKALSSQLQREKARIDQIEANLELAAVKKSDAVSQSLQSEREARTLSLGEMRTRIEKDAAELRHHVNEATLKLETTTKQERDERLAETAEIRSMLLDLVSRQVDPPGPEGEPGKKKAPEGEILTLYGMVKEALGDTVRLSMEIDEEKKQRQEECALLRKQVRGEQNVPSTNSTPAREPREGTSSGPSTPPVQIGSPHVHGPNVVWPMSSKTPKAAKPAPAVAGYDTSTAPAVAGYDALSQPVAYTPPTVVPPQAQPVAPVAKKRPSIPEYDTALDNPVSYAPAQADAASRIAYLRT